jgi:divinyl chlorophyllide a 8-vinyl-reductase
VVAGATGYIGSWVVQECVRQGHDTYALARTGAAPSPSVSGRLKGATLLEVDYEDPAALAAALSPLSPSVAISCLASRSGVKADAYKVDYQATSNFLSSSLAAGASHFTLLSAFCVKNPWLHFQQAKLKFEGELEKSGVGSYAIVRPTAFFKSVSAQLEVIQKGAPYVRAKRAQRRARTERAQRRARPAGKRSELEEERGRPKRPPPTASPP